MNYRIIKLEENGMGKDITKSVKGFLMFLSCGAIIVILLMTWVLFVPSPRTERVKIAMHNEQTFKKLQAKHGKKNTGVVVYEANGKAYFYNEKNEKVSLK
jgi:hypothetical protein